MSQKKTHLLIASFLTRRITALQSLLYAVDILLAYRALCLYRMNRTLVILNIVFFLMCSATTATLLSMAYKEQFGVIPTPAYLTGCWSELGNLISASAIPGLIFELWLFCMVAYRVFAYTRKAEHWNRHGIVRLLVQDSMGWFFMCVF